MAYPASLKNIQLCPMHSAVYDECVARLASQPAAFSFDQVVKHLHFQLVASAINWDRIAEWLRSNGMVIMPVPEGFFTISAKKRANMSEADMVKFICVGGRTKKCAGYASTTIENGVPAMLWGNQKVRITNGTLKAVKKFSKEAHRENKAVNPASTATARLGGLENAGRNVPPHALALVKKK